MDESTISRIYTINQNYLNGINTDLQDKIYSYLKDKKEDAEYAPRNKHAISFIGRDQLIGKIIRSFNAVINCSFVGLIETGDLIFLSANQSYSFDLLDEMNFNGLKAQIHYYQDEPNIWLLTILDSNSFSNKKPEFKFFVPERIMNMWRQYSLDKNKAINLKEEFFSRIFIFSKPRLNELPFFVVNIDRDWLNEVREHQQ